jgi:hypothetical protein
MSEKGQVYCKCILICVKCSKRQRGMQGFIEKVIKNLVISHLRDFIDLFRCVKVSFTFYIAMLYFFFSQRSTEIYFELRLFQQYSS